MTSVNSSKLFGLVASGAGLSFLLLTGCTTTVSQEDATILEFSNANIASMCSTLSADALSDSGLAFQGTVISTDDENVTIRVNDTFKGATKENVIVPRQEDNLSTELSIGALEINKDYLISVQNGVIATCGQSGEATPELIELYDEAFGR